MFKKLAFTFFFLIFTVFYAQEKVNDSLSILVYYEGQGFLQPFIETTIKKLNNINTNQSYFKSVNSFNRFINDNKYQAELSDLINSHRPENIKLNLYYNDSEKEIRERIFKILKEYDYFLTVKTNTLGELIEFQFQLFETITSKENIPYNISDKTISVENYFINPKEPQYLVDVKNSIYRLFKDSNEKPIARLKIYDQDVYNNDTIRVPVRTPIFIDGSASYDFDTEKISYDWKSKPKPNENFQTFDKINFEIGASQQNITIHKDGIYLVKFNVNDGVLNSKELNIYLETSERGTPINLKWSESTDYSYASLKYPEAISEHTVSYYMNSKKNDSTKFIVTNKEIGNKYVGVLHKKNIVDYNIIDSVYTDRTENNLTKEISIQSNFDSYPRDSINKFYIYNINKDSILSDPKLFKHRYIQRKAGAASIVFSGSLIQGYDFREITSEGDSIYKRNSSTTVLMEGSVYLTPRIELVGSFPVYSKGRVEIGEFSLKPHSSLSLFTNYYIVPKSNSRALEFYVGIGGGFSNYYRREGIDNSYEIVYLQEARAGVQAESFFFKKFNLSWGFRYTIGKFNKSIFNDLYYFDMGFYTKFRF